MAYIKQNWVDGETICNAERMNHIENGIANSLTTENIKTTQTNSDTATYSCNYINVKGKTLRCGINSNQNIQSHIFSPPVFASFSHHYFIVNFFNKIICRWLSVYIIKKML